MTAKWRGGGRGERDVEDVGEGRGGWMGKGGTCGVDGKWGDVGGGWPKKRTGNGACDPSNGQPTHATFRIHPGEDGSRAHDPCWHEVTIDH